METNTPLTLEERAEFLRLYALAFFFPMPGDIRAWTDGLLVDWFLLSIESHPDFDFYPEESWGRLAGEATLTEQPLPVVLSYFVRCIRKGRDFGETNGVFLALGNLALLRAAVQ